MMFIKNGLKCMNEIKIIIDNDVINEYAEYYFKQHPKARKKPIERPTIPSLNTWIILPRPQMNALKQKHKDFGVWLINKLGLQDRQLDKFEMEFSIYMPTKRRSDNDNFVPKFILDAFTESGFIVDDDNKHLTKLIITSGYDKENPRTEIKVNIL